MNSVTGGPGQSSSGRAQRSQSGILQRETDANLDMIHTAIIKDYIGTEGLARRFKTLETVGQSNYCCDFLIDLSPRGEESQMAGTPSSSR